MSGKFENKLLNPARVLLFSQRNIYNNHFRCANYEFEDIITKIDSVELLAPQPKKWFKYGDRIAQRIYADTNVALYSGIPKTRIKKNYDLFFAAISFPKDLLNLNVICKQGWRDHFKTSICWLNEIWASEVYKNKDFLKILSKFDYVIINCSQSVSAVNEVIRGECFYLPPAVDAILFCPYPKLPSRLVDVYSIGRRSEETHRSLLRMVREDKIFYVYDTIAGSQVFNPSQHRLLFANTAKRSKYFIVNPGKIDSPEETNRQSEIGPRYFEGAASGTIMIGEHPQNEEFEKIFYWPDAVIRLPFGSAEIGTIIHELDMQSQRQERIRRSNIIQSLLHHDWVYRWEAILKMAGLEPLPGLVERKGKLAELSKIAEEGKGGE